MNSYAQHLNKFRPYKHVYLWLREAFLWSVWTELIVAFCSSFCSLSLRFVAFCKVSSWNAEREGFYLCYVRSPDRQQTHAHLYSSSTWRVTFVFNINLLPGSSHVWSTDTRWLANEVAFKSPLNQNHYYSKNI